MTDQDTGPRDARRDPELEPEPGPDEEPEEPDDEYHLQGHKIMTEEDLDEVFADEDDVEVKKYRRWRHVLHGAVLVLLLAGLVGAVVAALAVMRGELQIPGWGPRTQEPITCPSATYKYPANDSFTLNVYNSTNEGGLARQAARELAERGYQIGEVASKDLNYYGLSAVVMSGPKGEANAMNLQRNIAGTEYVADDRQDESVDVILGSRYEGLVPANKVNKEPGTLSCPRLESPDPGRPVTPDAAK
ncbi:LytR C-terminal domain-containing protein [Arthrobacter mobilis]|uniref:LytR C-terminal domain-containing protein n=1 Tax=Arthrobacter mobilis TaxID=2724944 RepID=A0A7X6HC27_9MICC|nr:LytR C-terminal domain-containing protein [Arthrobacter mobilis]NKX54356.1 LytR C-terminal domain-containing protein [Arthrobacter mobilis]